MERRVYVLSPDLVARIAAFQADAGHASEVEAVRFLLDAALSEKEDGRALQLRAETMLAAGQDPRRMLFGHPALKSISGLAGVITAGPVDIECKDGHRFMVATRDAR